MFFPRVVRVLLGIYVELAIAAYEIFSSFFVNGIVSVLVHVLYCYCAVETEKADFGGNYA